MLLRVDELRLHLRPVAQRLVAHQVIDGVVDIAALGNVDECAVLACDGSRHASRVFLHGYLAAISPTQHLAVHVVGDSAYGGHRRHHHVLYYAYVEVGIGSYHRATATGGDVLAHVHRIAVGLLARSAEDDAKVNPVF